MATLPCLHNDPLPAAARHSLSLASEAGHAIDYYYIAGESLDEVIAGYRQITGKAVMLPRWAYGFWQSRQRYKTQAEILDVVREYRRRGIPLDNIVEDWFYWRRLTGDRTVRSGAVSRSQGHDRAAARAAHAFHDLGVAEVLSDYGELPGARCEGVYLSAQRGAGGA